MHLYRRLPIHSKSAGPLLSRLEASARQLGWRVEASIQPAVSQPGGLKELTLHPVIIQLEDTAEPAAPAYARLIDWLRTASSLPRRVEVVSLQLRSAGSGLRKAQIELHLFSLNSSEEVSPK